jgi:hypothetical protein
MCLVLTWRTRCRAPLVFVAVACGGCASPFYRAPRVAAPVGVGEVRPAERVASKPGRPTVGVAFGGGSARGIAHVGVIRWFEEHRIPIDAGAGTSMVG